MEEKIEKISTKAFVMFNDIAECIKNAQDDKSKRKIRSLLNALASYQSELEEYYKNPEKINDIECK